jgi:hypothetical protein
MTHMYGRGLAPRYPPQVLGLETHIYGRGLAP